MKIEARKVVTLAYDLYVDGENGQEELMEKPRQKHHWYIATAKV